MNGRTCLVCGGNGFSGKYSGLIECDKCGFVTTERAVPPDKAAAIYDRGYFKGREYRDYLSEKDILQKNLGRRLRTLLRYVEDPPGKRLYEIGSAYGFFLELAGKYFSEVRGIDVFSEGVEYARENYGLNVDMGDFLEAGLHGKYDVFCLWDTIEHLARPDKYIERISEVISPGGLVAITTGDIKSFNARMRKGKWRQIHPPSHIHYFSKKTLMELLSRYGFVCEYRGYPGVSLSLDTIFYTILALRGRAPGIYRALSATGLLGLSVHINCFDLLYVIARKKR